MKSGIRDRRTRGSLATLAVTIVAATVLAGCGGGSAGDAGADKKLDVLRVGFDPGFGLPYVSFSNGKWSGYQIDQYDAVAKQLGVKVEYVKVGFDSMTASLQAKRIDIAGGGFQDTPVRQKTINIIDNIKNQTISLQKADDPATSIADFCGSTVALLKGNSADPPIVEAISKKCPDGKSITMQYLDTAQGPLSVKSGRVRAYLIDNISVGYISSQSKGLKGQVLSDGAPSVTCGDGTRKDAEGLKLAQDVAAGFNKIIEAGTYEPILKKYGLPTTTVPQPVVVNAG